MRAGRIVLTADDEILAAISCIIVLVTAGQAMDHNTRAVNVCPSEAGQLGAGGRDGAGTIDDVVLLALIMLLVLSTRYRVPLLHNM